MSASREKQRIGVVRKDLGIALFPDKWWKSAAQNINYLTHVEEQQIHLRFIPWLFGKLNLGYDLFISNEIFNLMESTEFQRKSAT